MNKINQRIELAANIIFIIVAVMLGAFIAKQLFFTSTSTSSQNLASNQLQTRNNILIELEGVDFSEKQKTLILGLQASCRLCADSAPFYKRLIENSRDKNIKIVAALPSSLEESQAYFQKLGINGLEIKQTSLDKLQISGTPTLILVNQKGEVINRWVGVVPSFKEEEVMNAIFQ